MTKAGMGIHPVRTEGEHRAAVARIEQLIGAVPDSPEGDELDVLATLVDAYEARYHAMDAPSPLAAIRFRMDQQQLKRKDLEPWIGSRARVSEVLTGKRALTLTMIRRLRDGLGIPADVLIPCHRSPGNRTVKTVMRPKVSAGKDASRTATVSDGRRARKVASGISSER